jgi:hypothetical protein
MKNWTRRSFTAATSAAAALPLAPAVAAAAPASSAILSRNWSAERLASALPAPGAWKPFPTASDRAGWQAVPEDARRALVAEAEPHLGQPWPTLPANLLLGFARTGNRSEYEHVRSLRRERLRTFTIAECVEGRGRFLDDLLNGLWATLEETWWGVPAHLGMQKAGRGLPDIEEPVVDLFAAETSAQLAWTEYLLAQQLTGISPLITRRIRLEIQRRVLDVNLHRSDFGWMALGAGSKPPNNWNPWICSNWLVSVLLIEPDPARRAEAVHKILRCLDRFLDGYAPDGGCDEGPSYWGRAGASLFDNLDLLHRASSGTVNFFDLPLIAEIGRYISRAHVAGPWYVNFADAPARAQPPADLVFRYGRAVHDDALSAMGSWLARRAPMSTGGSINRQLAAIFNLEALRAAPAAEALVADAWLAGIQVMTARVKAGSAAGFYLAAQGGHNAESHNHNDVGNFVVYCDGEPLLIDIGVETYTAKTFSAQRYDIWTMQSAWHNLPTVDGVMQSAGREFEATHVACHIDAQAAELALNIEKAYPPAAGIESWRRTLRLNRAANQVEISDRYKLARNPGKITLTLMTPHDPRKLSPGTLGLGPARVLFDPALEPVVEEVKLADPSLQRSWGPRLFRVLLTATRPPAEGEFQAKVTPNR